MSSATTKTVPLQVGTLSVEARGPGGVTREDPITCVRVGAPQHGTAFFDDAVELRASRESAPTTTTRALHRVLVDGVTATSPAPESTVVLEILVLYASSHPQFAAARPQLTLLKNDEPLVDAPQSLETYADFPYRHPNGGASTDDVSTDHVARFTYTIANAWDVDTHGTIYGYRATVGGVELTPQNHGSYGLTEPQFVAPAFDLRPRPPDFVVPYNYTTSRRVARLASPDTPRTIRTAVRVKNETAAPDTIAWKTVTVRDPAGQFVHVRRETDAKEQSRTIVSVDESSDSLVVVTLDAQVRVPSRTRVSQTGGFEGHVTSHALDTTVLRIEPTSSSNVKASQPLVVHAANLHRVDITSANRATYRSQLEVTAAAGNTPLRARDHPALEEEIVLVGGTVDVRDWLRLDDGTHAFEASAFESPATATLLAPTVFPPAFNAETSLSNVEVLEVGGTLTSSSDASESVENITVTLLHGTDVVGTTRSDAKGRWCLRVAANPTDVTLTDFSIRLPGSSGTTDTAVTLSDKTSGSYVTIDADVRTRLERCAATVRGTRVTLRGAARRDGAAVVVDIVAVSSTSVETVLGSTSSIDAGTHAQWELAIDVPTDIQTLKAKLRGVSSVPAAEIYLPDAPKRGTYLTMHLPDNRRVSPYVDDLTLLRAGDGRLVDQSTGGATADLDMTPGTSADAYPTRAPTAFLYGHAVPGVDVVVYNETLDQQVASVTPDPATGFWSAETTADGVFHARQGAGVQTRSLQFTLLPAGYVRPPTNTGSEVRRLTPTATDDGYRSLRMFLVRRAWGETRSRFNDGNVFRGSWQEIVARGVSGTKRAPTWSSFPADTTVARTGRSTYFGSQADAQDDLFVRLPSWYGEWYANKFPLSVTIRRDGATGAVLGETDLFDPGQTRSGDLLPVAGIDLGDVSGNTTLVAQVDAHVWASLDDDGALLLHYDAERNDTTSQNNVLPKGHVLRIHLDHSSFDAAAIAAFSVTKSGNQVGGLLAGTTIYEFLVEDGATYVVQGRSLSASNIGFRPDMTGDTSATLRTVFPDSETRASIRCDVVPVPENLSCADAYVLRRPSGCNTEHVVLAPAYHTLVPGQLSPTLHRDYVNPAGQTSRGHFALPTLETVHVHRLLRPDSSTDMVVAEADSAVRAPRAAEAAPSLALQDSTALAIQAPPAVIDLTSTTTTQDALGRCALSVGGVLTSAPPLGAVLRIYEGTRLLFTCEITENASDAPATTVTATIIHVTLWGRKALQAAVGSTAADVPLWDLLDAFRDMTGSWTPPAATRLVHVVDLATMEGAAANGALELRDAAANGALELRDAPDQRVSIESGPVASNAYPDSAAPQLVSTVADFHGRSARVQREVHVVSSVALGADGPTPASNTALGLAEGSSFSCAIPVAVTPAAALPRLQVLMRSDGELLPETVVAVEAVTADVDAGETEGTLTVTLNPVAPAHAGTLTIFVGAVGGTPVQVASYEVTVTGPPTIDVEAVQGQPERGLVNPFIYGHELDVRLPVANGGVSDDIPRLQMRSDRGTMFQAWSYHLVDAARGITPDGFVDLTRSTTTPLAGMLDDASLPLLTNESNTDQWRRIARVDVKDRMVGTFPVSSEQACTLAIVAPTAHEARVSCTLNSDGGLATATVDFKGAYYTNITAVTVAEPPAGGTRATLSFSREFHSSAAYVAGTLQGDARRLASVTITASGEGYTSPPTITVVGMRGRIRTTATAVVGADGGIDRIGLANTDATDDDGRNGEELLLPPVITHVGGVELSEAQRQNLVVVLRRPTARTFHESRETLQTERDEVRLTTRRDVPTTGKPMVGSNAYFSDEYLAAWMAFAGAEDTTTRLVIPTKTSDAATFTDGSVAHEWTGPVQLGEPTMFLSNGSTPVVRHTGGAGSTVSLGYDDSYGWQVLVYPSTENNDATTVTEVNVAENGTELTLQLQNNSRTFFDVGDRVGLVVPDADHVAGRGTGVRQLRGAVTAIITSTNHKNRYIVTLDEASAAAYSYTGASSLTIDDASARPHLDRDALSRADADRLVAATRFANGNAYGTQAALHGQHNNVYPCNWGGTLTETVTRADTVTGGDRLFLAHDDTTRTSVLWGGERAERYYNELRPLDNVMPRFALGGTPAADAVVVHTAVGVRGFLQRFSDGVVRLHMNRRRDGTSMGALSDATSTDGLADNTSSRLANVTSASLVAAQAHGYTQTNDAYMVVEPNSSNDNAAVVLVYEEASSGRVSAQRVAEIGGTVAQCLVLRGFGFVRLSTGIVKRVEASTGTVTNVTLPASTTCTSMAATADLVVLLLNTGRIDVLDPAATTPTTTAMYTDLPSTAELSVAAEHASHVIIRVGTTGLRSVPSSEYLNTSPRQKLLVDQRHRYGVTDTDWNECDGAAGDARVVVNHGARVFVPAAGGAPSPSGHPFFGGELPASLADLTCTTSDAVQAAGASFIARDDGGDGDYHAWGAARFGGSLAGTDRRRYFVAYDDSDGGVRFYESVADRAAGQHEITHPTYLAGETVVLIPPDDERAATLVVHAESAADADVTNGGLLPAAPAPHSPIVWPVPDDAPVRLTCRTRTAAGSLQATTTTLYRGHRYLVRVEDTTGGKRYRFFLDRRGAANNVRVRPTVRSGDYVHLVAATDGGLDAHPLRLRTQTGDDATSSPYLVEDTTGSILATFCSTHGVMGNAANPIRVTTRSPSLPGSDVAQIVSNDFAWCVRYMDATVGTWGHVYSGGDSASVQAQLTSVATIAATRRAFVARLTGNTVVPWGGDDRPRMRLEKRSADGTSWTPVDHHPGSYSASDVYYQIPNVPKAPTQITHRLKAYVPLTLQQVAVASITQIAGGAVQVVTSANHGLVVGQVMSVLRMPETHVGLVLQDVAVTSVENSTTVRVSDSGLPGDAPTGWSSSDGGSPVLVLNRETYRASFVSGRGFQREQTHTQLFETVTQAVAPSGDEWGEDETLYWGIDILDASLDDTDQTIDLPTFTGVSGFTAAQFLTSASIYQVPITLAYHPQREDGGTVGTTTPFQMNEYDVYTVRTDIDLVDSDNVRVNLGTPANKLALLKTLYGDSATADTGVTTGIDGVDTKILGILHPRLRDGLGAQLFARYYVELLDADAHASLAYFLGRLSETWAYNIQSLSDSDDIIMLETVENLQAKEPASLPTAARSGPGLLQIAAYHADSTALTNAFRWEQLYNYQFNYVNSTTILNTATETLQVGYYVNINEVLYEITALAADGDNQRVTLATALPSAFRDGNYFTVHVGNEATRYGRALNLFKITRYYKGAEHTSPGVMTIRPKSVQQGQFHTYMHSDPIPQMRRLRPHSLGTASGALEMLVGTGDALTVSSTNTSNCKITIENARTYWFEVSLAMFYGTAPGPVVRFEAPTNDAPSVRWYKYDDDSTQVMVSTDGTLTWTTLTDDATSIVDTSFTWAPSTKDTAMVSNADPVSRENGTAFDYLWKHVYDGFNNTYGAGTWTGDALTLGGVSKDHFRLPRSGETVPTTIYCGYVIRAVNPTTGSEQVLQFPLSVSTE